MARLAAAALTVALLLAGCAGQEAPADAPETATPGVGEGGSAPLDAASSVEAPDWQVGQWWEWRLLFADGEQDQTWRSIVLEAGASGAFLATDSEQMAKEEAAFGNPMLGEIGADLQMDGYGGSWDLLDFPLTDGKAWTATIPNIAWDVLPFDGVDVAMTATFDEDLQGFRLMGHVEQGMLMEGTYLPATGWFGEVLYYDIDPGQEGLEVGIRAESAGTGFTGSHFTATAEPMLLLFDGNGFDDVPTEGGQPVLQPQPHGTFTMQQGTILFGAMVAVAVIGARAVTLTDPANQQRQVVATGAPEGEQVLWIDEPGQAGQWTVATTGAGGFSGGFVELYEITLTEATL